MVPGNVPAVITSRTPETVIKNKGYENNRGNAAKQHENSFFYVNRASPPRGSISYFRAYDNLFSDRTKKMSPTAKF
jgi:hypothetical protein